MVLLMLPTRFAKRLTFTLSCPRRLKCQALKLRVFLCLLTPVKVVLRSHHLAYIECLWIDLDLSYHHWFQVLTLYKYLGNFHVGAGLGLPLYQLAAITSQRYHLYFLPQHHLLLG